MVSKEFFKARSPLRNRNALFNQKCTDLVYRCCATGHQARPDTMECLQIELILAFLGNRRQVRPQGCFCNGLSIIVVILLSLDEGLYINGWDDTRFEPEFAQGSTDKMSAQARFHADNASWKSLKGLQQGKPIDLLAQNKLAIIIKANQMECVPCRYRYQSTSMHQLLSSSCHFS